MPSFLSPFQWNRNLGLRLHFILFFIISPFNRSYSGRDEKESQRRETGCFAHYSFSEICRWLLKPERNSSSWESDSNLRLRHHMWDPTLIFAFATKELFLALKILFSNLIISANNISAKLFWFWNLNTHNNNYIILRYYDRNMAHSSPLALFFAVALTLTLNLLGGVCGIELDGSLDFEDKHLNSTEEMHSSVGVSTVNPKHNPYAHPNNLAQSQKNHQQHHKKRLDTHSFKKRIKLDLQMNSTQTYVWF